MTPSHPPTRLLSATLLTLLLTPACSGKLSSPTTDLRPVDTSRSDADSGPLDSMGPAEAGADLGRDGWSLPDAAPLPGCSDQQQNGSETDVDCGGPDCPHCALGQACTLGSDCASGVCSGGLCSSPPATCSDQTKNGGESDVDCGQVCPTKCANGKQCLAGPDCASGCCQGGRCSTCGALLVEAESFTNLGGWKVDSQFVELMGSAYLLAHGLGQPVADASTTVQFPKLGPYRVWVRTKDWVPPHAPGTFKVKVGAQLLSTLLGTRSGWGWQDAGTVTVTQASTTLRLVDQSGFDGRCDALFFTQDTSFTPPGVAQTLLSWRRKQLGLPDPPPSAGTFDLVVVGGGIAGASATLAAARLGLSVALIHDRAVVGGNASQEVRVHTCGYLGEGFARSVVDDLDWDKACEDEPAGSSGAIAYDTKRLQVLNAEPKAHLFLEHRAIHVQQSAGTIQSVDAVSTRSGALKRFHAPLFVDATGDGWIGYWAGAAYRMGREPQSELGESLAPQGGDKATLGSSVLWSSVDTGKATAFPDVRPWTSDVVHGYHATSGNWTWEYGIPPGLSTIDHAEQIRDHLLRAAYGSFYNAWAFHGAGTRHLDWVAYIAGKRESRRLEGDLLLKEQHIRNRVAFPDTVVIGSWPIDLHVPNPCVGCCTGCGGCGPACSCSSCGPGCELDFISRCEQTHVFKYAIPFRALYSKNINNLMMAGRDLSASHVALGGTRVQNTNGQMGVAVAVAAKLCKQHGTSPRGVYQSHLSELVSTTTGLARPLGPLLRNGYVQSDGSKSWSQTCDISGGGVQDCGAPVHAYSTWSLPPATVTPDAGTHISDRYAFTYVVGGKRMLRNGLVQSDGKQSWSQTCEISSVGETHNCGGFTTWPLPPAGVAPDSGRAVNARYAFTYKAGSVWRLHNGFVQSDGKKSWSQTCQLDPATGATKSCGPMTQQSLPPAGVVPDANRFISDRYAFAYRSASGLKLRNGFMQSDGAKSWSQTCDIGSGGAIDCSLATHPFSQWNQPPAQVVPAASTTANRRYVFVIDPYE